jgi:hypothetical protein
VAAAVADLLDSPNGTGAGDVQPVEEPRNLTDEVVGGIAGRWGGAALAGCRRGFTTKAQRTRRTPETLEMTSHSASGEFERVFGVFLVEDLSLTQHKKLNRNSFHAE